MFNPNARHQWEDIITRTIFIILGIMVIAIPVGIVFSVRNVNNLAEQCDSKGGYYLENSRIVGKLVEYDRVCVRKDIVIPLE